VHNPARSFGAPWQHRHCLDMPVYGWIHLPINMDRLLETIRIFEEATKDFFN
jgi:hypothetical protein